MFYDRNPGDARVKVGSERQAATSPASAKPGEFEIGYTTIWLLSAGALQIWPCYMGIYSHKIPYPTVGFSAKVMPLTMKELGNLIKANGFYTFYPKIGYTTIGILSAGALQNRCCQRGVRSQKEPCRYRSKAGQECKAPRRYVCKS